MGHPTLPIGGALERVGPCPPRALHLPCLHICPVWGLPIIIIVVVVVVTVRILTINAFTTTDIVTIVIITVILHLINIII